MIPALFTVMPFTIVLAVPENVTVEVARPVFETIGVNPPAEKGP